MLILSVAISIVFIYAATRIGKWIAIPQRRRHQMVLEMWLVGLPLVALGCYQIVASLNPPVDPPWSVPGLTMANGAVMTLLGATNIFLARYGGKK